MALLLLGPAARPAWADGGDLQFADNKIQVHGLTAGSVSYDEATSTLRLDGATLEHIQVDERLPRLALELSGESATAGDWLLVADNCDVAVRGDGSARGDVRARSLEVASGTIVGNVWCYGDFSMSGGSVAGDVWYSGDYAVSGGNVSGEAKHAGTGTGGDGDLQFADNKIQVHGLTAGSVSYDEATSTLRLDGATLEHIQVDERLPRLALELSGESATAGDWLLVADNCDVAVRGDGSARGDVRARSLEVASGTILGGVWCEGDFKMSGGRIAGDVRARDLEMAAGDVLGNVSCSGDFTMTGGRIEAASGTAVTCLGFDMSGGEIVADRAEGGVRAGSDWMPEPVTMSVSGGAIRCISPHHGIIIQGNATFNITGGTVEITDAKDLAVGVSGYIIDKSAVRNAPVAGGVLNITGGSVTATLRNAKGDCYAIYAKTMTNDPSCLEEVNGRLPDGASFEVGGNVYKHLGAMRVSIAKYGSTSKNPKFDYVTFAGRRYQIEAVGSEAFATPQGAKVKSIEIKFFLACGPKAFYGTKSLTKLTIKRAELKIKEKGDKLVSVKWGSCTFGTWGGNTMTVEKGAFSGCGKSGGKKLTVVLNGGTPKENKKQVRKLFTSKGMNKGFKLKTKG